MSPVHELACFAISIAHGYVGSCRCWEQGSCQRFPGSDRQALDKAEKMVIEGEKKKLWDERRKNENVKGECVHHNAVAVWLRLDLPLRFACSFFKSRNMASSFLRSSCSACSQVSAVLKWHVIEEKKWPTLSIFMFSARVSRIIFLNSFFSTIVDVVS